ncbi:ribonuclease H-like domain-containing protein [Tanacetum coccineum]
MEDYQIQYGIRALIKYGIAYLLFYVDDIILTASSSTFSKRVIASLHGEFCMTDLGLLNYFLGNSAHRSSTGLFLSESTYAEEILERAYMQNCNPCMTPVDIVSKLEVGGDPVCLYMHDSREPHLAALKRILRYVCGTIDHGLQLHVSSMSQLTAYTDANRAGCPVTLSRSSAEAEYRGVENVVAKTAWIRNLLRELHVILFTRTIVYCDNFRVLHVPSRFQYADIFTKSLPTVLFLEFRTSLNVRRPPAQTANEY